MTSSQRILFYAPLCFAVLVVGACSPNHTPQTVILAIDRSLSAADRKAEFAQLAINANQKIFPEDSFEFYVFDSAPSQVHIGRDVEISQFKTMATESIQPRPGDHPSDLSTLISKIAVRLKSATTRSKRVIIVTDCGMDGTDTREEKTAKETVQRWIQAGVGVQVLGVDSGRLDDLTRIFPDERVHSNLELPF